MLGVLALFVKVELFCGLTTVVNLSAELVKAVSSENLVNLIATKVHHIFRCRDLHIWSVFDDANF